MVQRRALRPEVFWLPRPFWTLLDEIEALWKNSELTCNHANLCAAHIISRYFNTFNTLFMGNLTRNLPTSYRRNLPRCCPETTPIVVASPSCPIFRFSLGRAAARVHCSPGDPQMGSCKLSRAAVHSQLFEGVEDPTEVDWDLAKIWTEVACWLRLDSSWYFKAYLWCIMMSSFCENDSRAEKM